MMWATIGLSIIYVILILWLLAGLLKESELDLTKMEPKTSFSIIIPFRNESKNLLPLLESIVKIQYPKQLFEVLLIDDESTDNSVRIIEHFCSKLEGSEQLKIRILSNKRTSASPKKDAISMAIDEATNSWIITTDADVIAPPLWLESYHTMIELNNPKMVCGPVTYSSNKSFVQSYQVFDSLSLQAVAMGSFANANPLLCNGANMGYKKDAFKALNGFQGNTHIASGDDIFLLEKFKKAYPKDIYFLKTDMATVTTKPQNSWSSLVNQRVRWASKTSQQKSSVTKAIGLLVFITNIWMIVGAILTIFTARFLETYLLFLILKFVVDISLTMACASFFRKKIRSMSFLLNWLLYPIITTIVVFKSFTGTYRWKDRNHKIH